jgi:hypothetical protein
LEVVGNECRPLGIDIRGLDISIGKGRADFAHYVFRFRDRRKDDSGAVRLAEAFAYGLALAGAPLADADRPLALPIPAALINRKRTLSLDALVSMEKSRPWRERTCRFPESEIAGVAKTTTADHEFGWRVAAVTYKNEKLFDATRFLRRSFENFYVYPGGISEVVFDHTLPTSGATQSRFEDALQSAFKAIEAAIGDPPKDNRRFFAKLANVGVEPAEDVGYLTKVPIHTMIRRMNEARDKRAAHGSTPNRGITAAELLDYQGCAAEIVVAALEHARGSPL